MPKKILRLTLISIFLLGFALAVTGRVMSINSPDNYREIQDEIKTPEEFFDVWVGAERIYLCFRVGSYVNVYDRDGNFLWAVSAPYMDNAQFLLTETELIIFDSEAFVYNVENGEFITVRYATGLSSTVPPSKDDNDSEATQPGDLIFEPYEISEITEDGSTKAVISRPWWHRIFNLYIDLLISAISAIILGILSLSEKIKAWSEVRDSSTITHPEAKNYRLAILITIVVNLIATVINIFVVSTIIIVFLTAHFIIGGVIMYNLIANLSCTEYEKRMFDMLKAIGIASFTLLFFTLSFCL